jgi:hypothetical protein
MRFLSAERCFYEVEAEARQLALSADRRVGQPDLGDEATLGEHRQHARVGLVGLAGERRQPFGLLGIGDQHVPTKLFERVVDEARAGHRLDDRAHRLAVAIDAADEAVQALEVGRRLELLDDLAGVREQADIEDCG